MLRVTIELFPHGDEARKTLLGTMDIGNDGSGSPFLGSYEFRQKDTRGHILRRGHIGEFKRQRNSAWRLLQAILGVIYPDQSDAWRDGAPRGRLTEPTRGQP